MAADRRRNPKPRPKPKPTPKSAAQKAAEKALYASQQVQVEQTRARGRTASKGFTGNRQLRAGGTSLQQYDLERFKGDPFPRPRTGDDGGNNGNNNRDDNRGPRSGARGNDGGTRIKKRDRTPGGASRGDGGRGDRPGPDLGRGQKKDKHPSTVGSALDFERRREEEAIRRAKARAAAAAAAKKKKEKLTDSKGGVTKAIGGTITAS